jgi:hypothetical protein
MGGALWDPAGYPNPVRFPSWDAQRRFSICEEGLNEPDHPLEEAFSRHDIDQSTMYHRVEGA